MLIEKEVQERELIKFITQLGQLEPIEFMGICKIMSVEVRAGNKKARPYEDILGDLIDRYCGLERKRRREIGKLVRLTIKKSKEEKEQREKQKKVVKQVEEVVKDKVEVVEEVEEEVE